MKIAVITLGCRTNQAESDRLTRQIIALGHQRLETIEEADLVIINSCTVTAKADRQCRQLLNRTRKSGSKVIITGCYADRNLTNLSSDDHITVIDNTNKDSIINMIPNVNSTNALSVKHSRNRPLIKIQDGCDNRCSYCVVPFARGHSRSVPQERILEEVRHYVTLGYEEVVLSGIHLGRYGFDLSPRSGLSGLLEMILDKTGIRRIRLSSIEINEVNDTILDMIASNRVCNHLHIPLQGGTDWLLSSMNRWYTIKEYRERIYQITARLKNIAIGSDVMVGFPGESEDEFMGAFDAIRSIPFSYLHVFPFSRRLGTAAFNLPEQVKDRDKKKRAAQMLCLGKSMHTGFVTENIGLIHEIIVESFKGGYIAGTTSNYIRVKAPFVSTPKLGSLVKIKVARVTADGIEGIAQNEC
jgi:threonylcarbamoyladenosine tRNA methylthiotransferase MtaB